MFNKIIDWIKESYISVFVFITTMLIIALVSSYFNITVEQFFLILLVGIYFLTIVKSVIEYYKKGKILVPQLIDQLEKENSERIKLVKLIENLFFRKEFTQQDISKMCLDLFDRDDLKKYHWEDNYKYTIQEFLTYNDFNNHYSRTPELRHEFIQGVLNEFTVYWFYDGYKSGDFNDYQFKETYDGSISLEPKSTLIFIDNYFSEDKLIEFMEEYRRSPEKKRLQFNIRSLARDYLKNYKLMRARSRFFRANLYDKIKSFEYFSKLLDYDYYEHKKIEITHEEERELFNKRLDLVLDEW